MKHIYIIEVHTEYAMPKVSRESYVSLDKAQDFVERRSYETKKVTEFRYESGRHTYLIQELILR